MVPEPMKFPARVKSPWFALLLVLTVLSCTPVANMTWDGQDQLMAGQYYKAIDTYTHAINLNPNDAMAYLGRATAYEEIGQFDKALADFNSAVIILPRDSGVYNDRGLLYELMGNYDAALSDYDMAVGLDSGNANAYYNRGNAYMNKGNPAQAFESYRSAARLGHTASQAILRSNGMQW